MNYSDYRVVFRQVTARWREDAHANVIPTRHRGTEWFSPHAVPCAIACGNVIPADQPQKNPAMNESPAPMVSITVTGSGADARTARHPMLPFSPSVTITVPAPRATIAFIFRRSVSSSCGAEAKAKSRCGTSVCQSGLSHLSEKSKAVSCPQRAAVGMRLPHVPRLPRAQCHTAPARRNPLHSGQSQPITPSV